VDGPQTLIGFAAKYLHVIHNIVFVVKDRERRLVMIQVRVVVVLLRFVAIVLPRFGRAGRPQAEWRT